MAKRKNNLTPAEDYLDQIHWQERRLSSRGTAKHPPESKWKFRVLPPRDQIPMPLRLLFLFIVLGIAGLGIFALYQNYLSTGSSSAMATLAGFILVVALILVATFDKKRKL